MQDTKTFMQQIREMIRQESRAEAIKVYKELGTQYNVASVPAHQHNGVDSNNLFQQNIIAPIAYNTGSISSGTGGTGTTTFPVPLNLTRVVFQGFSYSSATAGLAAICNGEGFIGRGYRANPSGTDFVFETANPGVPFVQSANSLYIDGNVPTNLNAVASNDHICYVKNKAGVVVASLAIESIINNRLRVAITAQANWIIAGIFTFR